MVENNNGSTTETVAVTGVSTDQSTTTTSANGLSSSSIMTEGSGSNAIKILASATSGLDGGSMASSSAYVSTGSGSDNTLAFSTTTTSAANNLLRFTESTIVTTTDTFNRIDSRHIGADGSTIDVTGLVSSSGAFTGSVETVTSADGLDETLTYTDALGAVTEVQQQTTVLNADGSTTTTLADLNPNGTLRDRTITTTSGNGLSQTTSFDANGDGVTDETTTDATTLNADGSTTTTQTITYASGAAKQATTTNVSADGLVTTVSVNNEGVVPSITTTTTIGADGTTTTVVDNSYLDHITTTTTSPDGLSTTTTDTGPVAYAEPVSWDVPVWVSFGSYWGWWGEPVNGYTTATLNETTTSVINYIPDANGSYTWRYSGYDDKGNQVSYSSTHEIDANGIDTWSYGQYKVVISTSVESEYEILAENIYDTVIGGAMSQGEKEGLLEYINSNGQFDAVGLTNNLLTSDNIVTHGVQDSSVPLGNEFNILYGNLTNAEFVERLYQNADNRYATIAELTTDVAALASGATTQAELAISIAESPEHLAVGNVYAATTESNLTGGSSLLGIANPIDVQTLMDQDTALYQTALGASPSTSQLSTDQSAYLTGNLTFQQQAANLLHRHSPNMARCPRHS